MSHLTVLDELCGRYNRLPREAVVKTDLLTVGIGPGGLDNNLPEVVRLEQGPFGLRRTIVRVVPSPDSPYALRRNQTTDESPLALEDASTGELISLAWPFPEDPPYAKKSLTDGRSYASVVTPQGLAATPLGDSAGSTEPEVIGRVAAEMFLQSDWEAREAPVALRLISTAAGREGAALCLRYVQGVRGRIGGRIPLQLQAPPFSSKEEADLLGAGVDARLSNLLAWDPDLFFDLQSEQGRLIGRDEWIRRVLDQAIIYGVSTASPGIIVGLEMTRPWGAFSLERAAESAREWITFFAQHKVVARPRHIRTHPCARLAQGPWPPTELFLEVDQIWYEALAAYRLDEPRGFLMGPGRSRYLNSACFDLGRGAPLGNAPSDGSKVMEATS